MTTKKTTLKNTLLLCTPLISHLKHFFIVVPKDDRIRVDWYLLIDYTRRIDFAVMYYSFCINFIIMAYCIYSPKGIYKELKLFILITCILDLLHQILTSGQGFVIIKIVMSFILTALTFFILYLRGKK